MKIYKIIDNTNGNIYIGKTTQKYLCQRLSAHKSYKDCTSYEIIKNGDYKIELIEETEDDTRERYWILNTDCINKHIPGRTKKEWREDNKEQLRINKQEWYQVNKEEIQKYKRQRYKYESTWGGDKKRNNCLLLIDPNLFL